MKPKINIRRGLLSLALTAALIVSAIGVKEFMGQYAPTATPGVRVYATDGDPNPQEPTQQEQEAALRNAISYIQSAQTELAEFDDANKTLAQPLPPLSGTPTRLWAVLLPMIFQ